MISGEAYDVNKQTIYIAPKSKIESRAHYAPEHTENTLRAATPYPRPTLRTKKYCSFINYGLTHYQ